MSSTSASGTVSSVSRVGTPQAIESEVCVTVKCGGKSGELFPHKLKRTGKSLSKCIKHGDRWFNPNEFECLAGMHHAKKWKQSIRCEGKPLGEWLAEFEKESSFESIHTQECARQPGNVQAKDVHVTVPNNCTPHNDVGEEDNGVHNTEFNESACKSQSQQANLLTPSARSGENRCTSPLSLSPCTDLNQLLKGLEAQLSASLKEIINSAIKALREHVETALQSFRIEVEALTARVLQLEKETPKSHAHGAHDAIGVSVSDEGVATKQESVLPNASVVSQDQLQELQLKVESLSSKQVQLENEKEREKRKCNVLLGNLEESSDEEADELVEKVVQVLHNKLSTPHTPVQVMRIGKKVVGKNRLVLVRMNTFREKLQVLKAAKLLKGSSIYLMEDLSKHECENRKLLVTAMKKARSEGKKAFIRFADGKLIVNGTAVDLPRPSSTTPYTVNHSD